MGTEENENKAVSLTDAPLEVTPEEPIEQVMTQETTDSGAAETSEPTKESEDQEAFEETAKFEEEVEGEPSVSKHKTTRKVAKSDSKSISSLHDRLRKYSDAGKKTHLTIIEIQRKIKDLDKKIDTKHHQIVRDLQKQVKDLRMKIDRIDRSMRSTNRRQVTRKIASSRKVKDKSSKKKSRKR